MKWTFGSAIVLSSVLSCAPAQATTWYEVTLKCPIGGEKFISHAMGSNSYFGQRADGRPYSPSPIPPIDECPGNGFVIFDNKLSKDEIARLTPLIASAEYQAMRATETRHYRAWWLMSKIGRQPADLVPALMVAAWETDDVPERKQRYQAAFADAVRTIEFTEEQRNAWFWLRMRGANALRELGRFMEAAALIDATDIADRRPTDPDQLAGAQRYAAGLRALIADSNRHAEPANLIPPRDAIRRCSDAGISPAEVAACDSAEVKAEREEQRKWQAAAAAASEAADEAAGTSHKPGD